MAARKLSTLFSIEPGEGRPVGLMLACSFFIGSSVTLVSTAAYALFLSQLGAQQLPYLYMATSVVGMAFSFAYLKLSERLSLPKLMVSAVAFLFLMLVGARLGLALTTSQVLVFALPIATDLTSSLTNLTFWNLAGRIFNLRQAKRLFGVIGGGWELAGAAGGFLIPVLVLWIGTPNLLLVAAASIACTLVPILYLVRSGSISPPAPADSSAPAARQSSTSAWWRNRYVLLILGLLVVPMLIWCTLDLVFYDQADLFFAGEDRLASFLGLFFGLIGLLNLLGRSFVSAPLLKRYGVPGGLLLSPLALLANGVLVVAIGAIWGTAAAFFCLVAAMRLQMDLYASIADLPIMNILYQPLPAAQRLKVQALVDGVAYSLSIGLSGAGLWALTTLWGLGSVPLASVALVLIVVWAGVAVLLRREYPQRVREALAKRRLGSAPQALIEGSARAILQQELWNPSPGVAIYALTTLELMGPEIVAPCLPALLDHPDPDVRRDALQRMERLGLVEAAPAVRQRLAVEPSPAVRGAAVRTLAAQLGVEAFELTSPFLEDPAPEIRRGALVGLLRHGGIEGVLAAGNRLLQMAASPEATERLLAAQVLGDAGVEGFCRPLLPLLRDENQQVQQAALRAAGQLRSVHLWPLVVASLGSPGARGAAVAALVSGGEAALPAVFAGFDEAAAQPLFQRHLVSVCGRVGGTQAITWLRALSTCPHTGVRTQVLQALSRCGYRAVTEEAPQVVEQIRAEASLSARLLAIQADVAPGDPDGLLHSALNHLLAESRTRIFYLLSFLYDRSSILQARDNLKLPSADRRAYASELLDLLVSPELKRLFFPLLSDLSDEKAKQMGALFPEPPRSHPQRLEEIITDSSGQFGAWTQACALYAAGHSPASAPVAAVAGAAVAPDPLVRETALWAGRRLQSGVSQDRNGLVSPDAGLEPTMPADSVPVDESGGRSMLTTIEKVIALKGASVFAGLPDEILAELAPCLEEMEYDAGQIVFEKGDLGDCMYLIIDGGVRIHDGDRTLNELRAGEVFGEMAALDAEPRSASATAAEDTLLLRLDQQPLYEVMEDHIEVAAGIIRVLSRRLRERLIDLNQLRSTIER